MRILHKEKKSYYRSSCSIPSGYTEHINNYRKKSSYYKKDNTMIKKEEKRSSFKKIYFLQ